jgi:hypothetical protein
MARINKLIIPLNKSEELPVDMDVSTTLFGGALKDDS